MLDWRTPRPERLVPALSLLCLLWLAGARLAPAQSPSVRVEPQGDEGVLVEVDAAWPRSLSAELAAAPGGRLSAGFVRAAVGGQPITGRTLELPALAQPGVQVVSTDFDEVPLPRGAAEASAELKELLTGPPVSVEGVGLHRKRPVGSLVVRMLTLDPERGVLRRYRKIVARVRYAPAPAPVARAGARSTAGTLDNPHLAVTRSVLADGVWYKIPITREGVYRIDRAFLTTLGLSPDAVEPNSLRIYGNGGEPLPKLNGAPRPADLVENAVQVTGGGDGRFDAADALLFYARGPNGWRFNPADQTWEHYVHPFSRENYYFLRIGGAAGSRIQTQPFPALPGAETLASFPARAFVEQDLQLLNADNFGSGLDWLGPRIDVNRDRMALLPVASAARPDTLFPGLAAGELQYRVRFAARMDSRAFPARSIVFTSAGAELARVTPPSVDFGSENEQYIARPIVTRFSEQAAPGKRVRLEMAFSRVTASDNSWFDWLEVVYPRTFSAENDFLRFNTPGRAGSFEMVLTGFTAEPQVWDVTEPAAPHRLMVQPAAGGHRIQLAADGPRELVAFTTGSPAVTAPDAAGALGVPNQNLHGITGFPDFVIVLGSLPRTADEFGESAAKLADRRRAEGLEVQITDVQQIYNEFSGGVPDMRAVRDYLKFLYDRAPDEERLLRYVLLFGDGHYDYRNLTTRPEDGKNWVFPYESEETLRKDASFTSDDYFGLLDDGEGVWSYGSYASVSPERVDVGIGRFTVQDRSQAEAVVQKIFRYEDPATQGAWRTRYTLVADDDLTPSKNDENLHTQNADVVGQLIDRQFSAINLQKIYAISYPKETTAFGRRIPAAREDLIRAIREGTLVWNYSGHGGTEELADEKLFQREDVARLDNLDRLAVFVTATCSFGHWDINTVQSTAEELLSHPGGGAVALFTTVRLVYTSSDVTSLNVGVNLALNRHLLGRGADGMPARLGDAMRLTKNEPVGAEGNNRKFNLLGDPTMRMGLPERRVEVTAVNGQPVGEQPVQIRALERVSVEGRVTSGNGEPEAGFDGTAEVTVFDAARRVDLPYDTDGISAYEVQNDLIYRGQARVAGGTFRLEFVVPKDISYSNQSGRVSVYASAPSTDALGSTEQLVVGGTAPNVPEDRTGPEIEVFLNDTTFVSGGLTGQEPTLIVRLFDQNGLNAVGTGVGHEMLVVIDGNEAQAINVGDRFQGDVGSFQRGRVEFTLPELAPGPHTLTVKAWDVFNNSSTAELDFLVSAAGELTVRNVYNYPNPTTGPTRFLFEHNQPPSTPARVQLRVYTLAGRPVLTLEEEQTLPAGVLPAGPVQIAWDGRDEDLDPLPTGIYLYRVRVEVEQPGGERQVSETIEKLVVIR